MPSNCTHSAAYRTGAIVHIGARLVLLVAGTMLVSPAACAKDRRSADASAQAGASGRASAENGASGMGNMKDMPNNDAMAMARMSGDSGAMAGMRSMDGMSGMMADVQKQMEAMAKMSPVQMKTLMPEHRQKVANLLASMTADMRTMNMSGDAAWTATIDSVRQDLATMPDQSGREMLAAIPAHHARMMRLMEMHMSMTTKMNK
jgi:hypothetical protein